MRCIKPFYIRNEKTGEVNSTPCGRCVNCLINRRESWAIRLIEEAKNYDYKYFITLTYDDENLFFGSGENPTLSKVDLQCYIKRLRKLYPVKNFRYYAVGEYGTTTNRPHYHILLFSGISVSVDDVDKAWGKGNITMATVNIRRLVYTTKFHVNRTHSPEGCQTPFALMSKGIGKSYLTEAVKKFHKSSLDNNFYQMKQYKKPLPRYYRNKIFNKIDLEALKRHQKRKEVDNVEEIERYNEKHPKESFFKHRLKTNEAANSNFKTKVNFNEKI